MALAEQMANAIAQFDSHDEYKDSEVGWPLLAIHESLKNNKLRALN